jgi:hypothetical protein
MCYSRGSSEPGSARVGCPKGGLRPAACLRQLPFKATNARFSHITAAAGRPFVARWEGGTRGAIGMQGSRSMMASGGSAGAQPCHVMEYYSNRAASLPDCGSFTRG